MAPSRMAHHARLLTHMSEQRPLSTDNNCISTQSYSMLDQAFVFLLQPRSRHLLSLALDRHGGASFKKTNRKSWVVSSFPGLPQRHILERSTPFRHSLCFHSFRKVLRFCFLSSLKPHLYLSDMLTRPSSSVRKCALQRLSVLGDEF